MFHHNIYDLSNIENIDLIKEFENCKVSKEVLRLLEDKSLLKRFYVRDLEFREANILKQECLSNNLEAAISFKTYMMEPGKTDAILTGTKRNFYRLLIKLKKQPFTLAKLGQDLEKIIDKPVQKYIVGQTEFDWQNKNYIMGVVNTTPDSFFPGSRVSKDQYLSKIEQMINEGADILDIGGESTRPGSERVKLQEELDRVIPVIKDIKNNFNIPVSVDTYKSEVAEKAFASGADMLNDISALTFDSNMVNVLKEYDKPVCIMHIKGTPKNMQKNPNYSNLIDELYDYFNNRIDYLLDNGISENKIMIDPGIGFGKRLEDNLRLIKFLNYFSVYNMPILFAGSRKSFIGQVLGSEVEDRLYGTLATHLLALKNGASFVRVHDVKPMKDSIILEEKIREVSRFEY